MKLLRAESNEQGGVHKVRDRFLYIVSLFTIIISLFLAGLLVYWVVEPDKVFEVKGGMVQVISENKTVRTGEKLRTKTSFCKKIEVDGVFRRNFVSSATEIRGPEIPEDIGKACIDDVISEIPLPPQIAPGEYRLKYVATYKINPIKTVEETYYSEPFMVVE